MTDGTTWVGLDVHEQTIAVAVIRAGRAEGEDLGIIVHQPAALRKQFERLGERASLRVCYEAGPLGYSLYRQLTALGIGCQVVAPSLIPRKVSERVKTDRRDAGTLARLLRSGDLTAITVPTPAQEALRDLARQRTVVRTELQRTRVRLVSLLKRHGIAEPAGTRWTQRYLVWLADLTLREAADAVVLADLRRGMTQLQERLDELTAALSSSAAVSADAAVIRALEQLHGIGAVTAASLVAELGDLRRFAHPRQLMAYAGLVPSEHSSGSRVRRGGITKTGNTHVRRLLVEAAWHYARPLRARPGGTGEVGTVATIASQARRRLPQRYWRLVGRGKARQVAVVAVSRELLGFVWAVARAGPPS
jgi:transposase